MHQEIMQRNGIGHFYYAHPMWFSEPVPVIFIASCPSLFFTYVFASLDVSCFPSLWDTEE